MQSSSRKQHAKGSGKERKDIDTYGGQRQPQTADTEIFSPRCTLQPFRNQQLTSHDIESMHHNA